MVIKDDSDDIGAEASLKWNHEYAKEIVNKSKLTRLACTCSLKNGLYSIQQCIDSSCIISKWVRIQ
jgi:hypothetical protein